MQGVPHVFCFRRDSLYDGKGTGTPCITVRVLSKEASHELPHRTRNPHRRFSRHKRKRSLTFVSDLGAPEETRTPDLLIRSQTLYPAELPALVHRVCRGTYIIIPSTSPNVKQFFKVFCKKLQKGLFSAVIRHTFSFQTPHGRILLAVLRQTSYTISVYYGFGCDFL